MNRDFKDFKHVELFSQPEGIFKIILPNPFILQRGKPIKLKTVRYYNYPAVNLPNSKSTIRQKNGRN